MKQSIIAVLLLLLVCSLVAGVGQAPLPVGKLTRIADGKTMIGSTLITLLKAERRGDLLIITARYALPPADVRKPQLIWNGSFMKSMPPQVNLVLALPPAKATDSPAAAVPCDVVLQFDIRELTGATIHLYHAGKSPFTLTARD
jgi:hypothetical protein